MGSILYSVIPRTVIIDPNNTGLRGSAQNSGLSIQQVEENTEIINYDSIPTNEILNTECPISISPFTSSSVVLRLKRCRHCFVPFRMMAWLETHSTCPLCRISVVETIPETGTGTGAENVPQTATNNTNTLPSTSPDITNMLNNIRTNILNGFNNRTAASVADSTATPSSIANNATQLLNQLSNLTIDNVNDNSIMFSFDMPANSNTYGSRASNLNDLSNSYIIPQLSQLFSNSVPHRNNNDNNNVNNNDNNNDTNTDNNSDNDRMDLD
jgi:hypothetical protein